MDRGKMYHRDTFLKKVASSLGREPILTSVEKPEWSVNPQWDVYKGFTQEELVEVLKIQCKRIHTQAFESLKKDLPEIVKHVAENLGATSIVAWNDPRFVEANLRGLIDNQLGIETKVWNPVEGQEMIDFASKADVGITFSDMTLAESGTVVIHANPSKGRAVSLLPSHYIAIIPKSTIVPRMSQASREIHKKVASGERVPSCINFISGPSNSADIEMNLIVGVHGPVTATYIIVEDM